MCSAVGIPGLQAGVDVNDNSTYFDIRAMPRPPNASLQTHLLLAALIERPRVWRIGICFALTAGVLGALAGVLGSMMALEAVREIVGFGEGLVGRLLMVDARAMRFETLRYQRDPLNPLNGDALVITDLSAHR